MMKAEKWNTADHTKQYHIAKQALLSVIKTILIKLAILVIIYFLWNMLALHKSFLDIITSFIKETSNAQLEDILAATMMGCGLYCLSSIILNILIKPCEEYYILYGNGWTGKSHGYVRKIILWIIVITLIIIIIYFLWENLLHPVFNIDGGSLAGIATACFVGFFIIQDLYRLARFTILTLQLRKTNNINRV